jgi:DDE superfamily endonuclease
MLSTISSQCASSPINGNVRKPIPCAPGKPGCSDEECVTNGVAHTFMEVESLAGKRHVAVTERSTMGYWVLQIKQMLDERYLDAIKVRLVIGNLNTHNIASLYEAFEPGEARRSAERLEIHYTPKHESWFNMAEIELSVLKGQCSERRIADMATMQSEVSVCGKDRNNAPEKASGSSHSGCPDQI